MRKVMHKNIFYAVKQVRFLRFKKQVTDPHLTSGHIK